MKSVTQALGPHLIPATAERRGSHRRDMHSAVRTCSGRLHCARHREPVKSAE